MTFTNRNIVVSGFIEVAEGLIKILSFGRVVPSWSFKYTIKVVRQQLEAAQAEREEE